MFGDVHTLHEAVRYSRLNDNANALHALGIAVVRWVRDEKCLGETTMDVCCVL